MAISEACSVEERVDKAPNLVICRLILVKLLGPALPCIALLGTALPCLALHCPAFGWILLLIIITMITPGFLPCWSQLDKMSWLHGSIHLQHNHHHHHNIFINCVTRYKSVLQILSKRCQRKHLIFAQTRFCANAVCSFLGGGGGWLSIACAINFNFRIGTILTGYRRVLLVFQKLLPSLFLWKQVLNICTFCTYCSIEHLHIFQW